MKPVIDLTDREFGEWTVVSRHPQNYKGHTQWVCRCSCGTERVVLGTNLRHGKTVSCGHEARTADGLWQDFQSEYGTWYQMRARCQDPANPGYKDYGARNIWVCERWESFANFITDMGRRPFAGAQLDREDNDGPYSPDNCRWVSAMENANNSTSVRFVEFEGLSMSVAAWERRLGFRKGLVSTRLFLGWTVERALKQKPRKSPVRPN